MAIVRGMTPEAIRALLKKEIGDYQALSIAVSNARGMSESAIREVETIREDLKNMDFDFDTSQFDKAMQELEQNMSELNESLDKVAEESLARENKLTALETALNKDRDAFNKEMQEMAKELSDSKEALKQELTEATEKLAQNLTDVGTNLSSELEKANKTLSEDLAKDLEKLNTNLSESFGKDLKGLETRQNTKTDALDKNLKDYKSNTDSKMGTLLSEIDKAKAYAEGFLQPGNLVWNPMALDNARGLKTTNSSVEIESIQNTGKGSGNGLKVTNVKAGSCYVHYGDANRHGFELKNGYTFKFFAWVKSSVKLKSGAISLKAQHTPGANCGSIPANTWVKVEGEGTYTQNVDRYAVFEVQVNSSVPVGATIIIAEPYAIRKVTSDLIVDGAVTANSIATNAVTAGKIATDAVTANNIAAGAVNADKIVANAIGADKIAANAVTADKIAANAVNADKIAAKSIGADQLAANAVTAEKLAAKAVKAENIDSDAVTADKIAANAVTAGKVAANAITTREMTIEPGNLFSDPRFLDASGWGVGPNRRVEKTYGYENAYTIEAISQQTGSYYQPAGYTRDCALRLEPGASYRLTCRINFTGENPPDRLDVYLRYTKELPNKNTLQLLGGIRRDADNTNVVNAFGVGELDFSLPAEAKDGLCTIGFFLQKEHKTGAVSITDVSVLRAADASLIVKGGIQSDHIAANAITSDHISANSIDGDRIKSNTLDADKIKANSLTSDHVKFKDGFIQNAMIGDGQITNAKIKDLDAGKINAGTINAARIGANSITGAKIAANTITSKEIAANTITSKEIAANTITGKELAANTITGDNIKANTIRVGELHADAIVQSGMSLILSEATGPKGELEPIWWKIPGLTKFSDPEVDGEPWYGTTGDRIEASPPSSIKIKILQGMKYRLKFNIKATHPGSILFIEMRDQNGNRAVKSGAVHKNAASYKAYRGPYRYIQQAHDYTNSTEGNYLVSNYLVPTAPTQVVALIEFNPDVTHVYLSRFYFNHSNGRTTEVRISGLTLEADVPNQEEIDERQNRELTFLKKVTSNIATMLTRHEYYMGENFIVEHGFSGFRNHSGTGVNFPKSKDTIHFYLASGWDGKIEVQVTYMDGSNELFTIYSSDIKNYEFKEKYSIEPPPSNFENRNEFAYASVSTNRLKIPSYAYVTLRQSMSTKDMIDMLSRGSVPANGTLPIKRSYTVSSSPPWDNMGGSSRRPW